MRKNGSDDFALLAELAALIGQSADALGRVLWSETTVETGKSLREEMRTLYRRLMARLEREFVPPMERRDLADLGGKLFTLGEACAVAGATLRETPRLALSEGMGVIAATLAEAAQRLEELIGLLPQFQKAPRFRPAIAELLAQTAEADALCAKEIGVLAAAGLAAGTTIARYAAISRLRAAVQAFASAAEAVAEAAVNNG